ncbi:MAG: DUF2877 domain-containing protein [Rhodobacterales bacterium]|nr:DUF2877 domain-containing protein [Rhodobacterales bacterium]
MSAAWQAVAIGAAIDVTTGVDGQVHSVFDRAVNLSVGSNMWTIIADEARLSPFTICLPPRTTLRLGETRGAPIHVRAGFVKFGASVIDCRAACRWSGVAWVAASEGFEARLTLTAGRVRPVAWTEAGALATGVLGALSSGQPDLLNRTLAQTVGRGPGLTPSGDDVIVGILAALMLSPALRDGPAQARRLTRALTPLLRTTTEISRHLLAQAGQGHFSRPLHDLGLALHGPSTERDLPQSIDRALAVGGTSGADTCMGLIIAMRHSNSKLERSAA